MDTTTLIIVQNPENVLTTKSQKQVEQIAPNKKKTLVTICAAINAFGNTIPPLLVFSWKYFKDYIIKNAFPGTVKTASQSGWITSGVLHFIHYAKSSPMVLVLPIMNNYKSHISLKITKLAQKNNKKQLTCFFYISHTFQPLDKCVWLAQKIL